MSNLKVLHCADIHIDASFEQGKRCCNTFLDQAFNVTPDIIIIAGDIYDKASIKLDTDECRFVFWWISQLSKIAPVLIIRGTPTHEGNAIQPLSFITSNYNVVVSNKPEMFYLSESGELTSEPPMYIPLKAIISTMPTPTKQFIVDSGLNIQDSNDNLASMLTPIFAGFGQIAYEYPGVTHIHTAHVCIRGAAINENQVMVGKDIEIGKDQMELAKTDLICLGHIHLPQEVFKNAFYSGSLIRKNQGEMEEKGFYMYEIDKLKNVTSTFISSGADVLIRFRKNYTETTTLNIDDDIEEFISKIDTKNPFIKIEATMWLEDALNYPVEFFKDKFKDFGNVKIQRIIRKHENIRSEAVNKTKTLRDKVELLAKQNNDKITESILEKCDLLEAEPDEQIISNLSVHQ